jgi:hypothetical protein
LPIRAVRPGQGVRSRKPIEFYKLTDSMDVFVNATMVDTGKIVVDDVHDIANIQATSRNSSSDQNWGLARAESSSKAVSSVIEMSLILTTHLLFHAEFGQNELRSTASRGCTDSHQESLLSSWLLQISGCGMVASTVAGRKLPSASCCARSKPPKKGY